MVTSEQTFAGMKGLKHKKFYEGDGMFFPNLQRFFQACESFSNTHNSKPNNVQTLEPTLKPASLKQMVL